MDIHQCKILIHVHAACEKAEINFLSKTLVNKRKTQMTALF